MALIRHIMMKSSFRLAPILVVISLIFSHPVPAHEGDAENQQISLNLPFVYFAERMTSGTGPRPEFILQLPLGEGVSGSAVGGVLPVISVDSLGFTKQGDFWTSTNGFGKIFYVPSNVLWRTQVFVPYLTVYRIMNINYKDLAGNEDTASVNDWLVPGFQHVAVLKRPINFNIDAELYQYAHLDNYRIRTGFSYSMNRSHTISVTYDRQAWNINTEQNSMNLGMKGHSDTIYLRGIYRIVKGSKLTGLNLSVSGGYERFANNKNSTFPGPEDSDHRGSVIQIAVSGGFLAW